MRLIVHVQHKMTHSFSRKLISTAKLIYTMYKASEFILIILQNFNHFLPLSGISSHTH